MNLVALMAARNESWIIGASLRAALQWCDSVVVLNHASTDNTQAIVEEIAEESPGRVDIIHEPNPEWKEMDHRQRMLEVARKRGATHVAYADADEILTGNLCEPIREHIENLPVGGYIQMPMPCVWSGLLRWRDDTSVFGRALTMLAFRDRPDIGWKPRPDGYQFHGREPDGVRMAARVSRDSGGVMHLQFADRRRLLAKHSLYKMQEVVRWPGRRTTAQIEALYNMAPSEDGARFSNVPPEWWDGYEDLLQYIDLHQVPWQEAACRELLRDHGIEKFEGLTLPGVAGFGPIQMGRTHGTRATVLA